MYAELYEMRREDLDKGKVKRTKKSIKQMNDLARNVITSAKTVTAFIYAIPADDKARFEYLQGLLNMELQCASKYAKLVETDHEVAM